MHWSQDDRLICVMDDACYRLYSWYGQYTQHSLGKAALDDGVLEVRLWPTGFVYMTGRFQFFTITQLDDPRPRGLFDLQLLEAPQAWTVIPPHQALSRTPEVLLSNGPSILSLDAKEGVDMKLKEGPFTNLVLSPDGKLVALFSPQGKIWVYSVDFQQKLLEFGARIKIPPNQMAWYAQVK